MRHSERQYIRRIHAIMLAVAVLFSVISIPVSVTAETKKVRVGYYENEVFQEGAREGAVKTGYAYEYYRKLSEYTGWEYEYVYGGFGELYQMLLDGEIDLLAGLAKTEERQSLIGYPDAVMGSETYYLVKHDTDVSITDDDLSTLNGCRIGVLDSAMVGVLNRFLADNDVTAEVVAYPDHAQLFGAFDSRDVDILAVESDGAYGKEHSEVLTDFGANPYYLCVSIQRTDLLKELNDAQRMLSAEEPNYLNSLSAKYYSVSVTARAFSRTERDWMDTNHTLHVGYLENYLPYSDTDLQGNVTGIVKDIIPDILSSLGMNNVAVTYKGYRSYDDMIAGINSGEIDVAFPVSGGLYYSEESNIYLSNPVSSSPAELVYKGEFSDETTVHFAVNENNRMQFYFVRTNYPDAKITFYPSSEDCLEAVLSGKAGCMTLNGLRANDILRNRKYEGLSLRQTSYNDARCFGVKIGNEGLLKLLNRGINILGSDYAQNISYRYTDGLYSYGFIDALMDNMAIVGSAILAIAAVILFLLIRDRRRKKAEIREKEAARLELEAKNKELDESRQALSDALVTAEHANRAKTTFLNNMSHDIRTPMNAIVGFTALALDNIEDTEQVRDYLEKISVSSKHLLSLINDVLDMSRIESGKMVLDESEVNVSELVKDLRHIIQASADEKQLDVRIDTAGVVDEVIVTDKLRLNQVLLNIVSNAIKFTPEGGSICLTVTESPAASPKRAWFEFRIKDTGIGMSEEFQETIFEAFTREQTSTVSGIQGTGLGMAITKSIVDMMDGTISVKSEVGKGTEFVVAIPCALGDSDACSAQAPEARDEGASTEEARARTDAQPLDLPAETGAQPAETPASASEGMPAKPDFGGKHILLAEDNAMNQMIAEAILTEAGFTLDIVADGEQAVERMSAAPAGTYDAVLMDIQMPKMNGYEAAKRIRRLDDPAKARIPIVAVTANAFEEDRRLALDAGMDGHLAKPYDVPKMLATLAELL